MAHISTRSTGMPRNSWDTPPGKMVHLVKSRACRFPTTAHRAWRGSDLMHREREPLKNTAHLGCRLTDALPSLTQYDLVHTKERDRQSLETGRSSQEPKVGVISPSDASPFGSLKVYGGTSSHMGLQRAEGSGRVVLSGFEKKTRLTELYQRSPIRVMFPRTDSGPIEEVVLVNTAGGIAGGDNL